MASIFVHSLLRTHLCTSSHLRLSLLTEKLEEIFNWADSDIVEAVGQSYRAHMGVNCVGVNWDHPLAALQLVGLCLGGPRLSGLCNAFAVDYRRLSSGLPDLLLLRVRWEPTTSVESNELNVPTGPCLDLQAILGETWKSLSSTSPVVAGVARISDSGSTVVRALNGSSESNGPEIFCPIGDESDGDFGIGVDEDLLDLTDHPRKRRSPRQRTEQCNHANGKDGNKGESGVVEEVDVDVERSEFDGHCPCPSPRADKCDDADASDGCSSATALSDTGSVNTDANLDVPFPLPHPSCFTSDQFFYGHREGDGESVDQRPLEHGLHGLGRWVYEAMVIEVKGPTDRLAAHQTLWLRLLEYYGVDTWVAHLREG